MTRRVVITGMGMVSGTGNTVAENWDNIVNGRTGIAPITRFDVSNFGVKLAAEVKGFNPELYMSAKEVRRRDLYQQYIVAAAHQAIEQSGFVVHEHERRRASVMIGSGVGGVASYNDECSAAILTGEWRRITPMAIPMLMVNGGSDYVGIDVGARGPGYVPTSACATGGDCIGTIFHLIRSGMIDQGLAGSGDATIFNVGLAAFDRTGACSRETDVSVACQPFAKDRPGLVFGEGAAVLAIESLEHAQARGATILAEIRGYGTTADSYHITAPEPQGLGASEALEVALEDAGLNVTDIHYINAHGTGTTLNDAMETKAVKRTFGPHAYNVPMSSTKSMTGHAMGATASMEAIFCVLAIRDQVAPPTIALNEKDPECDLDYVPHTARQTKIKHTMSNSFGFGGHNVSLVISAFEG
ncbi:MAG: beta-ketoacyl-ACP synthase II [Pleurocapsa minor GSE-CHR-MK-17-07R]|jgi:beta-ketoacyl-acyl-carrier-protein synthase II|nr:beta-ketoacyl-ACP synthase II [Pleurocapsa minor GSE-CHR-MK 17-07R]